MKKRNSLFMALCAISFLPSCGEMCENNSVAELVSPDGRNKFVIFTRDCEATTGYSTQASIVPVHQPLLNAGGNLLAIDGKVNVVGIWHSANQLSIGGIGAGRVFQQESAVSGVAVTYDE